MCSLIALEAGSLKSRWWQGWFLLEAPRVNLFLAPLLAYSIPWLVAASLQSLPSSSHGLLCFCVFSLLLIRILVTGFRTCSQPLRASLVAQIVKNLPARQETWVWSLGREEPLKKGMAIHSSILAWRIPWTEKPGRLQSMGSQRVRHNWTTNTFTFHSSLSPYGLLLTWLHL